ncbi:Verrucotoxin subunit beta [Colletotrichum sp. SAR 10_99]|nr:Verrucotoxin subunit beta [Colletotrichum sp. SAR 10_99]
MGLPNDTSLSHPALGQDIQLGMLYDARTSQFFGGVSLWDHSVVNAKQELNEAQVQNADFVLSHSLEEARTNCSLDAEGSLSLDLKLFSATGSAKFLNDRKATAHEARRLLPQLRDGNTDQNEKVADLRKAANLFQHQTELAMRFVDKKTREADVLQKTLDSLFEEEFENHLGVMKLQSLTGDTSPRLFLSLGGPSIGFHKHPIQARIESGRKNSDTGESDNGLDEEWFENDDIIAFVRQSCYTAYRPGGPKKVKTSVGDIILDNQGRFTIVTGMLPRAPAAPCLAIDESHLVLGSLSDNSDYEVEVSVQTMIGASAWSPVTVVHTPKPSTIARQMMEFFEKTRRLRLQD